MLHVFAIEVVTFAVDFWLLEVEFSTFASLQFVALAPRFVTLAMELDVYAIELGILMQILKQTLLKIIIPLATKIVIKTNIPL